jgi:hypothetical protein
MYYSKLSLNSPLSQISREKIPGVMQKIKALKTFSGIRCIISYHIKMTQNNTDKFYQNLPCFSKFSGINEDKNFHEIPNDWFVIITDIKGSTKAIDAGRYKDVNTVGAAAIASVQNAIGDLEYPFVFGGDGATLLLPKVALDKAIRSLAGLKAISEEKFGLGLRVGVVPVTALDNHHANILVAKYKLIGEKCVAIFRGGGLTEAERLIKGTDEYEVPMGKAEDANIENLSCRWQAIPSTNGSVSSLLVSAKSDNHQETYIKVLTQLDEIFSGNIDLANPVNLGVMSYKSVRQCIQEERMLYSSIFSLKLALRVLEILLSVAIFKYKIPPMFFNPKEYAKSMTTHSDFRKFDDALRMVLDCTHDQIEQLRKYLEILHQEGEIYYGMYESKSALMTCYVQAVSEGNHIHFIDGNDGGYACAAKQLKGQMKE